MKRFYKKTARTLYNKYKLFFLGYYCFHSILPLLFQHTNSIEAVSYRKSSLVDVRKFYLQQFQLSRLWHFQFADDVYIFVFFCLSFKFVLYQHRKNCKSIVRISLFYCTKKQTTFLI